MSVDIGYLVEKGIKEAVFSKDEFRFIATLINSEQDTSAPTRAIEAYAIHAVSPGPIAEGYSLREHTRFSSSMLDKITQE